MRNKQSSVTYNRLCRRCFLPLLLLLLIFVSSGCSRKADNVPLPPNAAYPITITASARPTATPTVQPTPAPQSTSAPTAQPYTELTRDACDDNVQALQQRLSELGYPVEAIDGAYGSKTAHAVSLFQQAAFLPTTGIATIATQQALFADDAPTHKATAAPIQGIVQPTTPAQASAATQKSIVTLRPTDVKREMPISSPYIGNSNTRKFHRSGCSSVSDMKPAHRVPLNSRDDAVSGGYVPCKRCKP